MSHVFSLKATAPPEAGQDSTVTREASPNRAVFLDGLRQGLDDGSPFDWDS
jgi:hypothetical protein